MKTKLLVLGSLLFFILMISCSNKNDGSSTVVSHDRDSSENIEELIEKSTHIIVGEMKEHIDTVNLSRDHNDHSLPSKDDTLKAERNVIKVSKVLKGELVKDEIALVSPMSYETTYNGEKVFDDLSSFDKLEVGKQYILFLSYNDDLKTIFPLDLIQFEPASVPYIFSYDGKNEIKLIEKNKMIKSSFKDSEIEYDDLENLFNGVDN